MSMATCLKEIGRGKAGARSLPSAQAEELLRRVFAGQVSDVQLGAFVIAMRKANAIATLASCFDRPQEHAA